MIRPIHRSTALAGILAMSCTPLVWATPVWAQEQNGVIDLTPMLDAMGNTTGTAPAGTLPDGAAPLQGQPPATLPVPPSVVVDPGAPLPALTRAEAADLAATPQNQGVLRIPFTTTPYSRVLRLTGEVARSRLTFDVGNPAEVRDLTIALRSSVNLLPPQSMLRFSLNGTEILAQEPFAFDDYEMVTLPPQGIVAGTNTLDVTAESVHRIYCGPDASFQLWTEIDLGQSGVTLAVTPDMRSAGALRAAMAAQILRHGRVVVQSAGDHDTDLLRDLRRRIGGVLPGSSPAVVLRNPYAPLEAGATSDSAYIALVPATTPFVQLRQGGNGAQVLVIGGTPDAALLSEWLPAPAPLADVPLLQPAASVAEGIALSALGLEEILLESRYSKAVVPFTLPEDWFLIAAQEAHVMLDYTYAAGLPEGSLMLVKINGTTVRLLPLYGQGNTILPTLEVGFPVRLLSAGANELSFEAIVPGDPPELPCAAIGAPLVRIAPTTLIDIPPSPAMEVPRVSQMLRQLAPENIALIAGAPSGAIGEQVQGALAANFAPLADAGADVRLTVSGLGPVDRAPLDEIGLSRQRLEFVLSPQVGEALAAPAENPVMARLRSISDSLVQLAWPGDAPLDHWLDGKTGDALLFVTDNPNGGREGWLVVSPTANPETIARAVSDARFAANGPKGEAALLLRDGTWDNWSPASRVPILKDPLTLGNFRPVAGNYASWNPLYFVGLVTAFVLVSVGLALSFITRTRGQRKR